MDRACIVSVAFRQPYVRHSEAQQFVLEDCNVDLLYFRDQLPTKNGIVTEDIVGTFQKSLYGFKPHAIQKAIDAGYKKVIWFDPSVMPCSPIEFLIDSLDTHPMIVRTGDALINPMVNDKAVKWFDINREELNNVHHIGGTIYGFNFNSDTVMRVFALWKQAEEAGIFGDQDDFMAGHWADEACMVLAMHKCGVPQYWETKFHYKNQKDEPQTII